MKKDSHKPEETKSALLEAAAEIFAEKGFKGATTRDIAGRAGMNLASIHYHFRDKQGIYLAVVEAHLKRLQEAVPFRLSFPDGTPPEQRLEAMIESVLRRIVFGGNAGEWSIFIREIVDPGAAHDLLIERIARPHFNGISSAVAELLGPKAGKEDVRLCALSVVSQIVFHRLGRTVIATLAPEIRYDEPEILRLAKHIYNFSMMAMKGYRKELESRRDSSEGPQTRARELRNFAKQKEQRAR